MFTHCISLFWAKRVFNIFLHRYKNTTVAMTTLKSNCTQENCESDGFPNFIGFMNFKGFEISYWLYCSESIVQIDRFRIHYGLYEFIFEFLLMFSDNTEKQGLSDFPLSFTPPFSFFF